MQHRRLRDAASRLPAAVLVAILFTGSRADAQRQTLVALSAGVATDQRGVRSNAVSVAPTVAFEYATGATALLGGRLTQFGGDARSIGVVAALSGRDPFFGPLALTFDAAADASRLTAQQSWASFASLDLAPGLALTAGPVELFGGGRYVAGRVAQEATRQLIPGVGRGTTSTVSERRSGAGPMFGADVTMLAAGRVVRVGVRAERLLVSGVMVADRSAAASVSRGGIALSATVAQRRASDERNTYGSVGASIMRGAGDVTLNAAAGRYPSDRMTGALAGSYVNAGVSLRFGRSVVATRAPGPSARGVPRLQRGLIRLTIHAPDATVVEVAGDFNEWTPIPAMRAEDGVWYADLWIAPGQYRYAFRVNRKDWRVPRGATAVNDGFGGKSAWLTVAEPGA